MSIATAVSGSRAEAEVESEAEAEDLVQTALTNTVTRPRQPMAPSGR